LTIGNATVDEEGLPEGTAASGNSEIFNGSFTINTQGENLTTLTIGGQAYNLTSGGSQTLINNTEGMLTVTGVSGPTAGVYTVNYTYTLKDNVLTHNVQATVIQRMVRVSSCRLRMPVATVARVTCRL